MKKFTTINENFNLGSFSLSYNEFKEYQDIVKSIVDSLYPDKVNIDGLIFVARQSFDSPNRLKSIINYANSNMILCRWIVNQFNCKSKLELFNTIKREANNLFLMGGLYFKTVLSKLKLTESYGIRNEEYGAKVLSNILSEKGIDSVVRRTETDCRDDLIHGIDLYFNFKNSQGIDKKVTCQVKPLKSYTKEGLNFKVVSSGKLKPYNVNYLMFVDPNANKYILFRNTKDVKYQDKTVLIPISNLISIKD